MLAKFFGQFNLIDEPTSPAPSKFCVSFESKGAAGPMPRYVPSVTVPRESSIELPVESLFRSFSPANVYRIHFDGGANPNPGPASSGAILYSPSMTPVHERGVFHPRATNNYAEYTGLLLGLTLAKEHGVKQVDVYGDSMLVIKQMRGEYRVRDHDLLPLYQRAKELQKSFDVVKFRHVYREQNTEADRITKDILKTRSNYDRRF